MKVVVTGQVGLHKKPVINNVAEHAKQQGLDVSVFHVGERMYTEAPDVAKGRILDLPKQRLDALRRSVFKDIIRLANESSHMIINTHATFRWRHGLFPAFDYDLMEQLNADVYITLIDTFHDIHGRLQQDGRIAHSLADILAWREEEILATELLSQITRGHGHFYILSKGTHSDGLSPLYQLIFGPKRRKVYPSFPMTHVMDKPDILRDIDCFRENLAKHFITFDPGDLDEHRLLREASLARQEGKEFFDWVVENQPISFSVSELDMVASNIHGQTYARDFKLIDQSDMIVSYIPAMPDGGPALSSGVERELQHAYEMAKEVYVIWQAKWPPSMFVTGTATRVFRSSDEAFDYFAAAGYCVPACDEPHNARI